MITMVAFTTERGNPNKIGFNLIYINLKTHINMRMVTYKYTICDMPMPGATVAVADLAGPPL